MKMTCVVVKKKGCEDVKMICVDVKLRRCEERCEDVKMICVDVNVRRREDLKMYSRPPLLEEPFPRTLSGKQGE